MNTTATLTQAPVTGPQPVSTDIDFDTRLELAGIGMDVLLHDAAASVGQLVPEEAQTAFTEALAEADRYAVEALTQRSVKASQSPQLFQSHPILKRAGDLIRERGWTQGDFQSTDGALCTLGAIRRATGGDSAAEAEAVTVLLDRIRCELGSWAEGMSVPGWNDRREQTKDQVLRLLF